MDDKAPHTHYRQAVTVVEPAMIPIDTPGVLVKIEAGDDDLYFEGVNPKVFWENIGWLTFGDGNHWEEPQQLRVKNQVLYPRHLTGPMMLWIAPNTGLTLLVVPWS